MARFKLYLFGPPRLERDGQPVEINLRKALALLVYLTVTRQAHSRDALATLFWPEKDQQAARANLRRTLYDIGQLLGEQVLDVTPETVCLPASASFWLDIEAFQAHLGERLMSPLQTPAFNTAALGDLVTAAEIYTDDFLAGFTLPDSPTFDDWQFFQREELRSSFAMLLKQLVLAHQEQEEYEAAIRYARRWLLLDPLDEPVHRQLMQLYALAGQSSAALRQFDECVRILQEELGVEPEAETTALYESIRVRRFPPPDKVTRWQGDRVADIAIGHPVTQSPSHPVTPSPRHTATASFLHNLPEQGSPFVGRTNELREIVRSLRMPACRLLTVVGPGGIGKTRLALQAAHEIAGEERQQLASPSPPLDERSSERHLPDFADGIFFVPLQTVSTESGAVSAIAEATGFRFYSDTPPRQQLLSFLREKRILLVLDNMEHLPEGANLVAEILVRAPAVKLLVTSQRPLNLYEEWFHPLAGMTLPLAAGASWARAASPNQAENAKDEVAVADAVQLFLQSARRARADFTLDGQQEHVTRICRLVDGMPLALELAASWLKVLPCQKIADEIERGLDILTTRHQNIPLRHHSMRAVLEQTWQLLDEMDRDLLRRLSVFRGGFTQEAAVEVAAASLPLLASLVEKALVWVTPGGRYQIHELLRQFAQEQWAENRQEEVATRTRHSAYYLRSLSKRTLLLISKVRRIALEEIGREIDNLLTGWHWAAQQGNHATLNQAVEPLYHFYQIQSRYQEGKELFVQTWAHLQQANGPGEGMLPAIAPVRILARCGAFCHFLCEYETASQYLQESLIRAKALNHEGEVAYILNFLGQIAMWQGERATARQHLLESLAISQKIGDKSGAASALEKLANLVHATFGEYAESKQLAVQSLALSRELGHPDWIAYALDTLGFLTFCLGEYGDAETYYRESLELFQAIDDQYGIAMAQGGIGLVLWAMWEGKYVEATAYLQKSLLICRAIGHQGQVAGRLAGLARIANDLGDYEYAQQLAQEGLVIGRELGSPIYLSHILYCLGESAYGMGDLPTSRAYLMEALHVASEVGLLAYLAIALFHYATLLVKESEKDALQSTQKQEKAVELLALVQSHPAAWQVYKDRAARRLAGLETQLPPAIAAAAKARGASRALDEVVAEVRGYESTGRRPEESIDWRKYADLQGNVQVSGLGRSW